MPFKKGHVPTTAIKKGEVRNPHGRKGKNKELSKFIEDTLGLAGHSYNPIAVKKECDSIKNTLKNLPALEQVRVYRSFLIANKCADIGEKIVDEIGKRLDESRSGGVQMSNRDLSSMSSSISSLSAIHQKVIIDYIKAQGLDLPNESNPDKADNLSTIPIIDLNPTKADS